MKKRHMSVMALLLALVLMISMTACGNKEDGSDPDTEELGTATEETVKEEQAEQEEKEPAEVIKTIDGIDEDLGPREPLMIESITLYDDGSIAIVPTDELKKNEIKDDAAAVYPFAESGEADDVCVVDYGNGGYRTILALMKDGSISAVNGRALVEDHIFAVMDNVANRDNFVKIESVTGEDGSSIVATTDEGEEIILDFSLNFDQPEQ